MDAPTAQSFRSIDDEISKALGIAVTPDLS
jgi:hypothetical protein